MEPSTGAPLLGHTLGTPDLTVVEALELFASVGLDGAEIIWQDGYRCGLPEGDLGAAKRVSDHARSIGLSIGCLTPYITGINSLDQAERIADINRFSTCIETASLLECPCVRVYAGEFLLADIPHRQERWQLLVESLRDLGERAARAGVTLVVENHFNTMTVTARETADLVAAVDSPHVGALYDQANLSFTRCEEFEDAVELQSAAIRHVHVKDFVFVDASLSFSAGGNVARVDGDDRNVRSRVIGDGTLEWTKIVRALNEVGYQGAFAFEYEYRWHPHDLPEPAEGFALSVERMREIFRQLAEAPVDEPAASG